MGFFRWGAHVEAVPYERRTFRTEFADFEIPSAWRPGVYVAAFDDGAIDAREARALFTICTSGVQPPLLVVLPLFTYHAYNVAHIDGTRGEDEGECLYSGAPWVSLLRPGGGKWIGPRPPAGYTVRNARHWVFTGLGLEDGDVFGAQERLVGYECDGAPPESDLEIAADASINGWPVGDGSGEVSDTGRATLGVRTNNGSVFTASTVDWARALYAGDRIVGGINANVLAHFGAR